MKKKNHFYPVSMTKPSARRSGVNNLPWRYHVPPLQHKVHPSCGSPSGSSKSVRQGQPALGPHPGKHTHACTHAHTHARTHADGICNSPANSGSTPGFPPSWLGARKPPKEGTQEAFPNQRPKPPQVALFDTKEQQLRALSRRLSSSPYL